MSIPWTVDPYMISVQDSTYNTNMGMVAEGDTKRLTERILCNQQHHKPPQKQ